jgi:hypothetical protein
MEFDGDEEDDDEEDEEIEGVIQWMELQEADAASGVGLDPEQNHAQHGFPRTASARNNLTVLSQRYNVGALTGGSSVLVVVLTQFCGTALFRSIPGQDLCLPAAADRTPYSAPSVTDPAPTPVQTG